MSPFLTLERQGETGLAPAMLLSDRNSPSPERGGGAGTGTCPQICNHFSEEIRVTANLSTFAVGAGFASVSLPQHRHAESKQHSLLSAARRNLPRCGHNRACREELRYPGEGHPTGTKEDLGERGLCLP